MVLICNLNVKGRPKYFIAFSQETNVKHCSNVSHTPGSCCCFRPGNGFSSTRHRDLYPLRISSVQFVLLFGRGGERAESMFTCIVALVFVSILSPTSSRGTASRAEPGRLRKSPEIEGQRGLKQGAPVVTTQALRSNERRRKCWLSALRGPRYPGMSRVIETGEETFICGRRKLRLLYIHFYQ